MITGLNLSALPHLRSLDHLNYTFIYMHFFKRWAHTDEKCILYVFQLIIILYIYICLFCCSVGKKLQVQATR